MPDLASVCRREDALLVVVDVQQRLAAAMDRRDAVVASVVRLVKTAALVGVPIVVTRQYPKGLGDTDPAVAEAHLGGRGDRSPVSFEPTRSPSTASPIPDSPRSSRRAGVRSSFSPGWRHTSASRRPRCTPCASASKCRLLRTPAARATPGAHRVALDRMRCAGAVVYRAESVMYELVGAAGTDEFRSLLRIVKE